METKITFNQRADVVSKNSEAIEGIDLNKHGLNHLEETDVPFRNLEGSKMDDEVMEPIRILRRKLTSSEITKIINDYILSKLFDIDNFEEFEGLLSQNNENGELLFRFSIANPKEGEVSDVITSTRNPRFIDIEKGEDIRSAVNAILRTKIRDVMTNFDRIFKNPGLLDIEFGLKIDGKEKTLKVNLLQLLKEIKTS